MSKITFLVTKGETTYDMSELVESATWSGRKGSPARTLSVSLIDDDGWKHARSGIDVTKGNHCVFYWEGAELFRGIIMQQRQTEQHFRKMMHGRQFAPLVDFPPCQSRKNRRSGKPICDCCGNFFQLVERKKIRTCCENRADFIVFAVL